MQKIFPGGQFICCKARTETAQAAFTDWLLFETCGMERVLVPEIELAGFRDLFICEVCKILQDQRTDNNIDRSIRSGVCFLALQWSKNVFVDPCKYMIGKGLSPGPLQHLLFPFGKKSQFVEKG